MKTPIELAFDRAAKATGLLARMVERRRIERALLAEVQELIADAGDQLEMVKR